MCGQQWGQRWALAPALRRGGGKGWPFVLPCPSASLRAEPDLGFRGGADRTKAQGPGGQEGDAGVCDHNDTGTNVRGTGWRGGSRYGAQGQPGAGLGCQWGRDKEWTAEPVPASMAGKDSWWCSCTGTWVCCRVCLHPVVPGFPGGGWGLRGPALPLQWLSLSSSARVESPAVLQVPCVPPETVVTRAEETEQVGPVETEAEQVSLLHAPSVSPQEVSMRHSLPWPPEASPARGSPPSSPQSQNVGWVVGMDLVVWGCPGNVVRLWRSGQAQHPQIGPCVHGGSSLPYTALQGVR